MLYWMKKNQTATYFLCSRLFTYDIKISTAISIKHQILATFNIKNSILTLYAFNVSNNMAFEIAFVNEPNVTSN